MDFSDSLCSDVSLDSNSRSEDTRSPQEKLKAIQQQIKTHMQNYERIAEDNEKLASAQKDAQAMWQEFDLRIQKTMLDIESSKKELESQADNFKGELNQAKMEQDELLRDKGHLQEETTRMESQLWDLKQKTQKTTSVPDRNMIFSGHTVPQLPQAEFEVTPHILYPLEGGTALITFEEEIVAQKILEIGTHEVKLGDCFLRLEAQPVDVFLPKHIEIEMHVCERRVLISNIPQVGSDEQILDKLEIFFSKQKNGGGEVEQTEMMPDSRNVVLAFLDDKVAQRLAQKELFEVPLFNKTYPLKVTPFLNGKIKELQMCRSRCSRTVQLIGIPNIMEEDTLQDSLEIYFQKPSNGGGEVDAFVYVPLGKSVLAVFEEEGTVI
ncbi:interferon-induced protein 35 [Polypterus senegalus]|nr:interferon-induced protein 35 [Polypterus senegalus]XP_039598641.1 interferon-induced protein 35 [Polypterus senegalus]